VREILGVGWIDPWRVSDTLSIRGHESEDRKVRTSIRLRSVGPLAGAECQLRR
jgi:hypothetical protein